MPAHTGDSLFILRNLIAKDFKVRYRNMSLGILWSLVNPLVMMGVLTFIFTVVMPNSRQNFPLFVLIGILPYNFFSLAWLTGTTSIVDSGRLIKKVPFRRELAPLSTVLANSLHYFIQFGLLLLAVSVVIGPSWSWAWLPVVLTLQLVFVAGLTLATSALDVYLRDMRYVVESANLVLFWLVPIFYGFETIPRRYAWVYELNPVAAVIMLLRTILLDGEPPNPSTLLKFAVVSIGTMAAGATIFRRLQRNFADYL
jgi:ABC-2 type transport system permease protein/lipopolysaccharide transport system permease protein